MTPARHLQRNDPRPMDYRFLFLEPKGRLAPTPFARGLVVLTGIFMVITVLSAVVSPGLGILQYAVVFPYVCLFGKRLHDAGLSAWLWLVFLAGTGFFSMMLSAILLPVLSPQAYEMQAELQKIMEADGLNAFLEALTARGAEYARLSAVTSVATLLISSAFTGFAAYRMRSDPKTNRHGPPTLDVRAGDFS